MDPSPTTTSDVAAELLRDAFRKDRPQRSRQRPSPDRWDFWDLIPFDVFSRIPWHQWPAARHLPVPWFVPIGRFEQAVFAESFRQALAEGLAIHRSIELAAAVNPCPCFRRALLVVGSAVCAGYSLAEALKRSRAWVGPSLPAALEAGEQFGCLPDALAAFVRQDPRFTGLRFRAAIGRRPDTTRFALALAGLLRDHPLTWQVVEGAGQLSGGSRRFVASIDTIAEAMREGSPLVWALRRAPRQFDRLFCDFLERSDCREEMAACLVRLAVAGDHV